MISHFPSEERHGFDLSALLFGLAVLSFVEPSGIADMSTYLGGIWRAVHAIFSFARYMSLFLLVVVSAGDLLHIGWFIWLLVAYQFYIVAAAAVRGNLTSSFLATVARILGVTMLYSHCMERENPQAFLRVMLVVFDTIVAVNFLSVILFPQGMYVDDRYWTDNWILGYKNWHIYHFLPCLLVSQTAHERGVSPGAWAHWLLIAMMLATSFLSGSTTTLIAVAACAVLFAIYGRLDLSRHLSFLSICLVSAGVSVGIIIFGIQDRLSWFFEGVLEKSSTFTSRALIWDRAMQDFLVHPLSGNGLISYKGLFSSWDVNQMHNMYLDVIVVGGLLLLALLFIIFTVAGGRVRNCKSRALRNAATITFVAYALLFLMEARRDMSLLYVFLLTCYYLPNLAGYDGLSDMGDNRE